MAVNKRLDVLRMLFEKFCDHKLDANDYSGEIGDAVFEIVSAEAFIAGIATSILDNQSVNVDHQLMLGSFSYSDGRWECPGGSYDISAYSEVIDYAKMLNAICKACTDTLQH